MRRTPGAGCRALPGHGLRRRPPRGTTDGKLQWSRAGSITGNGVVMFAIEKPLPRPNEDTAPYWEAAQRGELRMQKCGGCGHVRFPPAVLCARCLSEEHEWA